MKRYLLEASSPVTPKKVKPKSEVSKTRALVRKVVQEALEHEKKIELEELAKQRKKLEEEQLLRKAENRKEVTVGEEQHVMDISSEESPKRKEDLVNSKEDNDRSTDSSKEIAETILVKKEEGNKKSATTEDEGYDTNGEEDKDAKEDMENGEAQIKMAAEGSKGSCSREKSGKKKLKKRNENDPEPTMKRCGEGCEGCRKKCAKQDRDECTNCIANKRNKDSKNPCFNRLKCIKEKPKSLITKEIKDKPKLLSKKDILTQGKKTEVQSELEDQLGTGREGGDVLKEVSKIEERHTDNQKRGRESTGTPEDNKKQNTSSGIPTKKPRGGKDIMAKK